jgi:hypothetical protein
VLEFLVFSEGDVEDVRHCVSAFAVSYSYLAVEI